MTLGPTIALGFVLGMRHATDADHVAAVAATVGRERLARRAAWIGVWWGLGHTLTIVVVGAAIVLFNWIIQPRLALAMEFAVGLMLVTLGLRNVGASHHTRVTPPARRDRLPAGLVIDTIIRPAAIGVVHGLAGSAAVTLMVMTTIPSPAWAMVYLLVFGVGTIAGMSLITFGIAIPICAFGEPSVRRHAFIRFATGLASVALGLLVVYRIAAIDGLFAAVPKWSPN
jgi:high-affinity nickel-transport protein